MLRAYEQELEDVNCRIGSLETLICAIFADVNVNCRIGSLENFAVFSPF